MLTEKDRVALTHPLQAPLMRAYVTGLSVRTSDLIFKDGFWFHYIMRVLDHLFTNQRLVMIRSRESRFDACLDLHIFGLLSSAQSDSLERFGLGVIGI